MEFFKNFNSNTMYKYIGIVVILLISVYISGQCLSYQNYVIEGLPNPNTTKNSKDHYANLDQELKDLNENKRDTLLISKYKDDHENLLIAINENTNLQLLQNINDYANALVQQNNKKCKTYLDNIDKFLTMNRATNSVMNFLNKN